jgi:hypothetical protein
MFTLVYAALVFLIVAYYLSTKWWIQIAPSALLLTGADFLRIDPLTPDAVQPIAFPHQNHVLKLGLDCSQCHTGVRTEVYAGLPSINICLGCHGAKNLSENPEEEKIREFAARGEEIQWIRLNQLPPHVYFSHERHVTAGRLACVNCMGEMANLTAPPPRALRDLRMEFCLNCHAQVGQTQDCLMCHK